MAIYRSDLMCEVAAITYDFDEKRGHVDIAANQSCDMGGCLALFRSIDPTVRLITVSAGGKQDGFFKLVDGEWVSMLAR